MKTKYKEIFKLKKMLEDANIPFGFSDHSVESKTFTTGKFEHYQICYPNNVNRWVSVIEGNATYGSEKDKLEIMGGCTPLEEFEKREDVIGYLTAKNVFKRIKNHYEGEKK